ncbi:MAG: exosortase-associated EpsI family protein [Phycisphaerales bacterium]|nr:exosortase-associated EpsI family protein [Phycisphaerales bacterium]
MGLGLVMAGLLGAVYALGLGSIRPDLLGIDMAPALTKSLLVASAVGLVVVVGVMIFRGRRLAIQGLLLQPFTLAVCAGMLVVAAGGLNGMVKASRMVLFKQEVPMRAPLFSLAERAGTWVMEEELPALPEEQVQTLGTRHYIRRLYRDKAVPSDQPGSMALLHIAYYTGTPDTVPHVPERCFCRWGAFALG